MERPDLNRGSLAEAHQRIAGLLDDLNETVDLVERLTRSGEHETAIRLVEAQRHALYSAVEGISQDVGVRGPRWWARARRNLAAAAAAALLAVSSIAISFGVLSRDRAVDQVGRAQAELSHARQIADPVARLLIIERVVRITRTIPADSAGRRDLTADLAAAIDETKEDIQNGDDPPPPGVVERAEALARQVQEPPGAEPPNQPPSTGEGPLEGLDGAANDLPSADPNR